MLKRIGVLLSCFCLALAVMAQSRTEVSPGIFIVRYGAVCVIENDNTQQSVRIKVVKSKSLYEVFCNDTLYRSVAKSGLKAAIQGAIISASGGTSGGWAAGAVAGDASERIYRWACEKLK